MFLHCGRGVTQIWSKYESEWSMMLHYESTSGVKFSPLGVLVLHEWVLILMLSITVCNAVWIESDESKNISADNMFALYKTMLLQQSIHFKNYVSGNQTNWLNGKDIKLGDLSRLCFWLHPKFNNSIWGKYNMPHHTVKGNSSNWKIDNSCVSCMPHSKTVPLELDGRFTLITESQSFFQ